MIKGLSSSAAMTRGIGAKLGRSLKSGDIVALFGGLGSGKTTLIQGIARGLGVRPKSRVTSPTFALVHEHEGRHKFYHMDWYRLDSIGDGDRELIEECFRSRAVTLIEWADRGRNILPAEYLRVDLRHAGPGVRKIQIGRIGASYRDLLMAIQKSLGWKSF